MSEQQPQPKHARKSHAQRRILRQWRAGKWWRWAWVGWLADDKRHAPSGPFGDCDCIACLIDGACLCPDG